MSFETNNNTQVTKKIASTNNPGRTILKVVNNKDMSSLSSNHNKDHALSKKKQRNIHNNNVKKNYEQKYMDDDDENTKDNLGEDDTIKKDDTFLTGVPVAPSPIPPKSVTENDRVLQGFSTAFDASVEEMWMAWVSGTTLVVGTKEIMRSGPDFANILTSLQITFFSTVPTLLATIPSDGLPLVRILIVGGESCGRELVNRFATNKRTFYNTYGPTEATVVTTYYECKTSKEEQRVPIGLPLPNYKVYIVSPSDKKLLPAGAIGELLIGGNGVSSHGYLNLPDKSAARFLPDPYISTNDETEDPDHAKRMYCTGDLARVDANDLIEFHGRIDRQCKIRGYVSKYFYFHKPSRIFLSNILLIYIYTMLLCSVLSWLK